MADMHPASPASGARPGGAGGSAPPYEPVVRLGTPPQPTTGATPSRVNHPVLLPDNSDDDDEVAPSQATPNVAAFTATVTAPAARPAPKFQWYAYVASGIVGAVLVTAIFGLLGSRSGLSGNRSGSDAAAAGGALSASDTAGLDRRADTLALAIAAFGMRANMFDTRRMPCSGLARGLTQVEDAWLGYNMARKNMLATSDAARDARDKSLYADVRAVEVRFERSSCTRP